MSVTQAYSIMFTLALVILAAAVFFALIRAIMGPRVADRLLAVNLINTLIIIGIVTLSCFMEQSWLLDVAIIYCLISFLAVVILAKVYIAAIADKRPVEEDEDDD